MSSVSLQRRLVSVLAAIAMLFALLPVVPAGAVDNSTTVWINEIHYDNAGTDAGEAIELAGVSGTDLTGWSIVLYNGANGTIYDTTALGGTIPNQSGGFGTVAVSYPVNGLQNGAPDGIALVDGSDNVVQFLSYEGSFAAVGGVADGLVSTDIGIAETSGTPVGDSLFLTDTGTAYSDFNWSSGTASFGAVNAGQTFGTPPELPDPWVNEFHYDNAGADVGEAIEVAGATGTDLDGWSIELYNGSTGMSYGSIGLSGTIGDDGGGFGAVAVDTPGLQNGSPDGFALVDAGGALVQFLSYEGSFTAVGGPADGETSTDVGIAESSSAPVGTSLQLTGAGTDPAGFTWTSAAATFGCVNVGQSDLGESACGAAPAVLIHEIQGSGDVSPLEGQRVQFDGVVVGDYEGDSSLRGFFVQEDDVDGDPETSEGIFVFHGSEDTVSLGDVVSVTGTVSEFFGQTQIGFPENLEVLSSGATVTPTPVTLPLPSDVYLERFEGMLVTLPQTLYVTEFFQLGRFGQVVVSSDDRLQQPTAVAEPGAAANAVQAANDLNRLILDDTNNAQNSDPIIFGRNGNPLTASNTLRGGDTLTGATGVLNYTFGGSGSSPNAYRVRPVDPSATFGFQGVNDRPASPPPVGGTLQVASFNVLNYFLTLDEGGNLCGVVPDDCRGAESSFEFERQRTKLLTALAKLDADVVGLMELENTPGVSPEADLVAGLNDLLGAGTYDYIDAGTVGDDVIRVGMLYQPAAVTPLGDFGVVDYGDGRNRASLTQTFIENATGEVFSVVVNHFKSKGCTDATGLDADQGDGQGCWNPTRVAAAQQLVAALSGLGHGDDDWLIIGDLNSYNHEDPIDAIKAAGFTDLALAFGGDEAYSYVFDGQWGYLDYALASSSLLGQVSGAAEYHINSDEPSVLDYNTNFKSANHVTELYAPNEFRTSDHDPVVVGLDLDAGAGLAISASPDTLWPPNHKYRKVEVTAPGAEVAVMAVVSSEADSGLGIDDLPSDIVAVDDDTLRLRAERYSVNGRTYTITALASGGGQALVSSTEVVVPHDQGNQGPMRN